MSSQDDSDEDDVPLAKRKNLSVPKKQQCRLLFVRVDRRHVHRYVIDMGKKAKVILDPFVVRDWQKGQEATSDDETLGGSNSKPSPKRKKVKLARLKENVRSKVESMVSESRSESPSPPFTPPAQLSPSSSSERIDNDKESDIEKKYLPPTPKNSSFVEERHGLKLHPDMPRISPARYVVAETTTGVTNTESQRESKHSQVIGDVKETSKNLFKTASNNHDVHENNASLPKQALPDETTKTSPTKQKSLLRNFRIVKTSSRVGPPITSASSSSEDESAGAQKHADHSYHGKAKSKTSPSSVRVPLINLEPLNVPDAKRATVHALEPPPDRKCMLCKVCNKDDFEGHLMRHFRDEIQTMLGAAGKRYPFLCPKCPDKKHPSNHDLTQHFGRDHKVALELYFKKIGQPISASPLKAQKELDPGGRDEEEVYYCSLCNNKSSPKLFVNVVMLKSHLFDEHFSSHVRDGISKEVLNSL